MVFKKNKIKLIDNKTNKKFPIDGYRVHCALYKTWIDVAFGQKKEVARFKGGCAGFVHINDEGDSPFLWVDNKNNLNTLVHQVYHLVNIISKNVSLSEDRENEQQAYLMGWLFDEIRKLN